MSSPAAARLPANQCPELGGLSGAIITDCADPNARFRQEANFANLFGVIPAFRGVEGPEPDFQAGCNLADWLGATAPVGTYPQGPRVALVNVAPRGDAVKRRGHENGTPFGHVQIGNAHIFSTVEGHGLSIVQRLGLADEVDVFDIPTIATELVQRGVISDREADEITTTQFRSLETLPKIAYEIVTGSDLPAQRQPIPPSPEVIGRVFEIDGFDNVKVAATPDEIGFVPKGAVEVVGVGAVRCVERLTDVPQDGELAVTVGSSGPKPKRFTELVIQRGRAARELGRRIGQEVSIGQQVFAPVGVS